MNKDKYLKELEKRLELLTPEQKTAEIFRINNELDSGKEINDLSNEVEEIYKKYNIDPKKAKKKKEKTKKKNGKETIFTKAIDSLKKNTIKENLTLLKDLIVIILIVIIFKIPFIGVETLLFSIFQNTIADKTYTIIYNIIDILYILFAIFLFIRLFKKRYKKELGLDK